MKNVFLTWLANMIIEISTVIGRPAPMVTDKEVPNDIQEVIIRLKKLAPGVIDSEGNPRLLTSRARFKNSDVVIGLLGRFVDYILYTEERDNFKTELNRLMAIQKPDYENVALYKYLGGNNYYLTFTDYVSMLIRYLERIDNALAKSTMSESEVRHVFFMITPVLKEITTFTSSISEEY